MTWTTLQGARVEDGKVTAMVDILCIIVEHSGIEAVGDSIMLLLRSVDAHPACVGAVTRIASHLVCTMTLKAAWHELTHRTDP